MATPSSLHCIFSEQEWFDLNPYHQLLSALAVDGLRYDPGMGERQIMEDFGQGPSYGETFPGPHSCDWPTASKGWKKA